MTRPLGIRPLPRAKTSTLNQAVGFAFKGPTGRPRALARAKRRGGAVILGDARSIFISTRLAWSLL